MFRALVVFVLLIFSSALMAQDAWPPECRDVLSKNQAQINLMQEHTDLILSSVDQLKSSLQLAQAENAYQDKLIEELEKRIVELQKKDIIYQAQERQQFFAQLAETLGASPIFQVLADRIIIPAGFVYVFGKAEIGAEGQDRLRTLANALQQQLARLPSPKQWRLRIEGHTDRRAIKANRRFKDNWDLSAQRALEMLRYLHSEGIPQDKLEAVGMGSSSLLDQADTKAAHRRNRRISILLASLADKNNYVVNKQSR